MARSFHSIGTLCIIRFHNPLSGLRNGGSLAPSHWGILELRRERTRLPTPP